MLGGRVKTLHPRSTPASSRGATSTEDLAALDEHGIEPFDLVCVNLYPFERGGARSTASREEEAVEMIDVGGPVDAPRRRRRTSRTSRRSAGPSDYERVLDELREDGRALARDAAAARRRGVRDHRRRTRRRSRAGSRAARRSRRSSTPVFEKAQRPRVRREPAPAARRTTPSAARAATCSPGSSSCTAASSRSTT